MVSLYSWPFWLVWSQFLCWIINRFTCFGRIQTSQAGGSDIQWFFPLKASEYSLIQFSQNKTPFNVRIFSNWQRFMQNIAWRAGIVRWSLYTSFLLFYWIKYTRLQMSLLHVEGVRSIYFWSWSSPFWELASTELWAIFVVSSFESHSNKRKSN